MSCQLQEDSPACFSSAFCTLDLPRTGVLLLQRSYVPGFERAYMVQSGVKIGVRETRRILSDYQLTVDDILQARKFRDVIACSTYPVDIHNPEGSGMLLKACRRAKLTTSRCALSCRVMPVSMATGQGADVCAALAVHKDKPPRVVPASDVQAELMRQGAELGRTC